jgi:hypothetical protein
MDGLGAERVTGQQYVNTLARLIETRKELEGNADGQQEADRAIRRMKAHVLSQHDEAAWARIEREADEMLSRTPPEPRGLRRSKGGIWLP